MLSEILDRLLVLQKGSSVYFPEGIFPSYRYHSFFPYKRADDNVYFTSFILIHLNAIFYALDENQQAKASRIIKKGEAGLKKYRSRFGDVTYNFYRPDGYFPNGNFLSKYKRFQPTDDADDTSIAYRAINHDMESARKAISIMRDLCNGKRGRWNKRSLKPYRQFGGYNTWIGSEELYVDLDICVISNVLCFIAKYEIEIKEEDYQSIAFIEKAVLTGEYLKKKWALAAWYPFNTVIFYQLSELLGLDYFNFHSDVRNNFVRDMQNHYKTLNQPLEIMIMDISFFMMGIEHKSSLDGNADFNEENLHSWTKQFSYGVIPLLQPFNSLFFQKLSGYKFFQLRYECEAQVLCFHLQWKTIKQIKFEKKLIL